MSTLSTHVLDTSLGKPAAGVRVTLLRGTEVIAEAMTDADGRVKGLGGSIDPGEYGVRFEVLPYFRSTGREGFYRVITIDFVMRGDEHYHVPLLLNPFGYSTYRGS
jgi:hydroxyisourate hydrolase